MTLPLFATPKPATLRPAGALALSVAIALALGGCGGGDGGSAPSGSAALAGISPAAGEIVSATGSTGGSSGTGESPPKNLLTATDCEAALKVATAFSATESGADPHMDNMSKHDEHMAALVLVNVAKATHLAARSGNWTDTASVWCAVDAKGHSEPGVAPGAGARAWVMPGVTVVVDADLSSQSALHTLRVSGTLGFATTLSTGLKVATIVIDPAGFWSQGPIPAEVTSKIIIADEGPINRTEDRNELGRGFISHGKVFIAGAVKAPYAQTATAPKKGDTTLVLKTTGSSWKVGDQLVLPGTHLKRTVRGVTEDEELKITAIAGNTLTLDKPLAYDHGAPTKYLATSGDLQQYVMPANFSRNVEFRSENTAIGRRGHIMFMHNMNVDVSYMSAIELGRTDKSKTADEIVRITGTNNWKKNPDFTNTRGRYAVHFHKGGTNFAMTSAKVTGVAVWGSPGWGIVNHSSYVDVDRCVTYNVFGAHFVTEAGDEIGTFSNNMAIRATGIDLPVHFTPTREFHDRGYKANGFWIQNTVETFTNYVFGMYDAAYMIFNEPLFDIDGQVWLATADLRDSEKYLADGSTRLEVVSLPMRRFSGNVAAASQLHTETWFGAPGRGEFTKPHLEARSLYTDSLIFGVSPTGIGFENAYSPAVTFHNVQAYGDDSGNYVSYNGFTGNEQSVDIVIEDSVFQGFVHGINMPFMGHNIFRNNTLDVVGYDYSAYAALTTPEARFKTGLLPYLVDEILNPTTLPAGRVARMRITNLFTQPGREAPTTIDPNEFFQPNTHLITTQVNGQSVTKQVFDNVQAGTGPVNDYWKMLLPPELAGKTNSQIASEFGITAMGAAMPTSAVDTDMGFKIDGGAIGPVATYAPDVWFHYDPTYTAAQSQREMPMALSNSYVLSVKIPATGEILSEATARTLHQGVNTLTTTVAGRKYTFFVYLK